MSTDEHPLFFCDMNAIPLANREQHTATTKSVFGLVQAIHDLPNGYAFKLPNEKGLLIKAAEFVENERLCCPFFSFRLEVESSSESIWLQITGPDGVKPFVQAEIGETLNQVVARASNFR
ncbi:MAG: hypothetical protein MCM46_04835 [Candidatus Manganitrophus sp. SB1]|nr:hypothetical protein [Candidatus Manganitrophus morganii]